MTVGQSANSHAAAKNDKFLETISNEDRENQILKRKTIICRGC